jgi:hypothetical protein
MKCQNRTQKGRNCNCIIMHRAKDSKYRSLLVVNLDPHVCLSQPFKVNISGGTGSQCTWNRFSICAWLFKTASAWPNRPLNGKYKNTTFPMCLFNSIYRLGASAGDPGSRLYDPGSNKKKRGGGIFFLHLFTKLIFILSLKGTKKNLSQLTSYLSIFN